LRTRGSQLRTERQFCQVGCEIIGDDGVQTDIEICVLAILGLRALGIAELTLDLNIPGFVARLTEGLEAETLAAIRKAVAQRDRDAVQKADARIGGLIAAVMEKGVHPQDLKGILFEPDMSQDIQHLCDVYDGVGTALAELGVTDVSLTVDVLEQAGFEYHKHLGFTLFSANVHGELGRGGSYDVRFGKNNDGQSETAKGFTLYMDTIGKACAMPASRDRVFVSCHDGWAVIVDLQTQGWIVVRGNDRNDNYSGCTHIYAHGKITKLN
jgi:ATP phosphoribosyltransferase regulatory subunit